MFTMRHCTGSNMGHGIARRGGERSHRKSVHVSLGATVLEDDLVARALRVPEGLIVICKHEG